MRLNASTLSTFYYEPVQLARMLTTLDVLSDSEFFSMPPVHADLRPVQAGGPPIWIGGASEAAMRRVGRSGTGWLGVDDLRDSSESDASVDSVVDTLERFAESGVDEAIVDAFALLSDLDQMLDFAGVVSGRWSDRGRASLPMCVGGRWLRIKPSR